MTEKRAVSSAACFNVGRARFAPVPPVPVIPWQGAHCASKSCLPWARSCSDRLAGCGEGAGRICAFIAIAQNKHSRPLSRGTIFEGGEIAYLRMPMPVLETSTYLHKSEYLALGLEAKTTAFFHSNGAAVWL